MKFESILYFFSFSIQGLHIFIHQEKFAYFQRRVLKRPKFFRIFHATKFYFAATTTFFNKKVLLSCSMSHKLLKVDVYQMTKHLVQYRISIVDLNKNVCIFFLLDFGSEPKISTICVQFIFRYQIHQIFQHFPTKTIIFSSFWFVYSFQRLTNFKSKQ